MVGILGFGLSPKDFNLVYGTCGSNPKLVSLNPKAQILKPKA